MKPETAELLRSLEDIEWFANAGVHEDVAGLEGVIWVDSLDEAVSHATSSPWQFQRMDAKNLMSRQVMGAGTEHFREYSRVQQEIHGRASELVSRKAARVIAEHGLGDDFKRSVTWDILVGALECELSDWVDPGLAGVILEIYRLGYLPCGMDQDSGELMVF
jgi:hypothetical protein